MPKVFDPIGFCIYCGAAATELTNEHIVPYGLNGELILPKSSCKACCKITAGFEQTVLREMWWPLRNRAGIKSRRKKEVPQSFTVLSKAKDGLKNVEIQSSEFPRVITGLDLPPPGLLIDRPDNVDVRFDIKVGVAPDDMTPFEGKGYGDLQIGEMAITPLLRMVAKIAHSLAYTLYSKHKFEPLLNDFILGEAREIPLRYIGGYWAPVEPKLSAYELRIFWAPKHGRKYMVVMVRLFPVAGSPTYALVVGRIIE